MSLKVTQDEHVTTITINRPKRLNALDEDLITELTHALQEAQNDARCIVLTGAGDKAFVAGADIAAMKTMTPQDARRFSQKGHTLLDTIENHDVPTIAAINGFALGGGLELALACDVRIASENATLGLPEVTLGVIPGFGGTQRLTRILGLGQGLDLLLTGRKIDATEAHRTGLITRLVPPGEALQEAQNTAKTIATNGPLAVALAKKTARHGHDANLQTGDHLETEAFAACFATDDQKEGMQAFLDKREPTFQGR